jgi:hypothetical protein
VSTPRLLGHYQLLSTHVAIYIDDDEVRDAAGQVLAQFTTSSTGGRSVLVEREGSGYRGTIDGKPFFRATDARACVTFLVWRLNELVAETRTDRLIVHASAAGIDGQALLFPGHSGAGKSTLVAALVRAGCSYISDELAVIPIGTSLVEPYPRAITLEQGTWAAFPELEDRVVRAVDQWFVPPDRLREGCVSPAPLPIAGIIFPQATPGAPTSVRSLDRGKALVRVARQGVNLAAHGPPGFHTLARIVRDARICSEMTAGAVEAAADAVLEAAAGLHHRGR